MFLLTPNWFILSERIHNNSVTCPAFKILGVYVDENLTFDYHIKTSLNKISKFMFSLNKIKNFLLTSALKSIYYALVHLHVFYCLPVVSCTSKKKFNSLSLKQKRCIWTTELINTPFPGPYSSSKTFRSCTP